MTMDGFLSFLLFAVLFYVMMRFGCGAHMVHGRHGDHQPADTDDKHVDPVCGKHVDPNEGYGWYVTIIWVPIYNFVVARQEKTAEARSPAGWQ